MKLMKKPMVLLVTLVLVISMGLYGCTQGKGVVPTPPTPEVPKITKIDITNTETTLSAGALAIAAKCTPDGIADTGFTVKLDTKTMGVTLDGKKIVVNAGAINGETVSVTVTSTADISKSASKSFKINIDDSKTTYVEITTGDELFANLGIDATVETMSKNYKLADNIELSRLVNEESKLSSWTPSVFPFTGFLNGNGYSIKGLNMSRNTDVVGGGFFLVNQGVIKNIGFDNSESKYKGLWMNLGANSGVIAGINSGGILNAYTDVPVASESGAVGAIVGSNSGFLLNSYAKGVAYSADTTGAGAGVVAMNSGIISGTVADKLTTELSYFVGDKAGQGNVDYNKQLLTSLQMQTTATYTTMGWDKAAWHYTNVYPILINSDFDADDIEQQFVITTPIIIEVGDYVDMPLQLAVNKINAANEEVIWSDKDAAINEPRGITVSKTGAVTFVGGSTEDGTVGKFDKEVLRIVLTPKNNQEDGKIDTYFNLRDDGYNSTRGIVVTTEQELYDTFYKTVGTVSQELSEWSKRAMSRTIKLGGHIALSPPQAKPAGGTAAGLWSGNPGANWRGVGKSNEDDGAFVGIFDGQGYSISGFDVKIDSGKTFDANNPYTGAQGYDANAAWGFFRTLGTKSGIPGVVRNLVIKDGVIDAKLGIMDGDRRHIGGIAQFFFAGLIENCIVDLKISSSTNLAGMVAGFMRGSVNVDRARLEGSTIIRNTLALGEISSSMPDGDGMLKPWEPHKVGAFAAYPNGESMIGSEFVNSYAIGAKDLDKNFTCRSDDSFAESNVKFVNSGFISQDDFQLAQTFIDLGFDTDVFSLKDNCYPTLKNATFNTETDQLPVPSVIKITKGAAYYDYTAVKDSGITIATTTINDKGMAPMFTIAGIGATIHATTGVVTIDSTIVDNTELTVSVTLGDGGDSIKGDTSSFIVRNDGYDSAIGILVANEDELYNTFFKSDDATHGITGAEWLNRTFSRRIVLTSDIVLVKHANWTRIPTTFRGTLSGNGHTISGLNVTTPTEMNNTGYGFFDRIEGKTDQVVIENLIIKGNISYQVKDWSDNGNVGGTNGVGALARELTNGTIQNVIVDVNIATNAEMNGKFAAYMKNDSKLVNCLAFGTMGNIVGVSNDANKRQSWAIYAYGAIAGKLDNNANFINSYALGELNDSQNGAQVDKNNDNTPTLGLANRQSVRDAGSVTNSGFKTAEEMNVATAFEGYDITIWTFEAGKQPTLKLIA